MVIVRTRVLSSGKMGGISHLDEEGEEAEHDDGGGERAADESEGHTQHAADGLAHPEPPQAATHAIASSEEVGSHATWR